MAIRFACACGAILAADEGQAGRKVRCPKCRSIVVPPSPPESQGPPIKITAEEVSKIQDAAPPPLGGLSLEETGHKITMRANKQFEGRVCAVCQAEIALGEDISVCDHCQSPFHWECWEANGGCATYGCEGGRGARPKEMHSDFSLVGGEMQPEFPAPAPQAAQFPAPQRTSGLAIASFVLGLVGLLVWGIGSLLAVIFGHLALAEIDKAPNATGGRGMAVAGLLLGYIGLAIALILMLVLLGLAAEL